MLPHTFQKSIVDLKDHIEICQAANNAIKQILETAISRKSLIVNDIPSGIFLASDERLFTVVLSDILLNTVNSSHSSCIRISAFQEYNETIIAIKDNHSDYSKYISGKMTKVQPIVKKLNGNLRFEFNMRNSIKIVLSFSSNTKKS